MLATWINLSVTKTTRHAILNFVKRPPFDTVILPPFYNLLNDSHSQFSKQGNKHKQRQEYEFRIETDDDSFLACQASDLILLQIT